MDDLTEHDEMLMNIARAYSQSSP